MPSCRLRRFDMPLALVTVRLLNYGEPHPFSSLNASAVNGCQDPVIGCFYYFYFRMCISLFGCCMPSSPKQSISPFCHYSCVTQVKSLLTLSTRLPSRYTRGYMRLSLAEPAPPLSPGYTPFSCRAESLGT